MPPRMLPEITASHWTRRTEILPAPALDPAADPLAQARAFARWCNTLPLLQVARAYRARDGEVRVYLDWRRGLWNPRTGPYTLGDARLRLTSYVRFSPGPVALIHRDPPKREYRVPSMRGEMLVNLSPAPAESLAAIRRWVAENGGAA